MRNIIITESQLRLITEALGVPDNILDAADMLYDIVEQVTPAGKNEYTMSGQSFFDDGKYSGFSKKDEKKLKKQLEKRLSSINPQP